MKTILILMRILKSRIARQIHQIHKNVGVATIRTAGGPEQPGQKDYYPWRHFSLQWVGCS